MAKKRKQITVSIIGEDGNPKDVEINDCPIDDAEAMKDERQHILNQMRAYAKEGHKDFMVIFEKLLTVLETVSKEFHSVLQKMVRDLDEKCTTLKSLTEDVLSENLSLKERNSFLEEREKAPEREAEAERKIDEGWKAKHEKDSQFDEALSRINNLTDKSHESGLTEEEYEELEQLQKALDSGEYDG